MIITPLWVSKMGLQLSKKQSDLFDFVKMSHGEQKRKYTGDPYWTHLKSVAEICTHYCLDFQLIIEVALCHDLLEDTEVTVDQLSEALEKFEYCPFDVTTIVNAVIQLTDVFTTEDYPKMNRAERKIRECERMVSISHLAQTVKCADLIDNTKSIVEYDKAFAKTYVKEKRSLLNVLRKAKPDLYAQALNSLILAEQALLKK